MGYLESISLHRIAPREVSGAETVADLIDHAFSAYNAGRLRELCTVFTRKFLEPDCTVGLTLSGALTPAGLGMSCLIPLDPVRLRRLDRLDRRQPLPRHPLRRSTCLCTRAAQPRRSRTYGRTTSSASTTSSSTTRPCSIPTPSIAS